MISRIPAEIGMNVSDIDTPALLVELDVFEYNINLMAKMVADLGVVHRPHAKTHKSPAVAHRQIAAGAIGQCCQKVSEAEILVAGGIADVLVSNQIVGRRKLDRLAALGRSAKISVCADNMENIAEINAAAKRFEAIVRVLVEIDVGGGRCGVSSGTKAVELAKAIDQASHLEFGGLQAYHGRAQHIRGFSERKTAISHAANLVRDTVEKLHLAGLGCEKITGAGTGTFQFEAASGIWNEIQAGSYCFMDADYGLNLDEEGEFFDTFRQSLFVLSTVMSCPARDRAVLDAGHKATSIDSGLPRVAKLKGVDYVSASDEHGTLLLGTEAPKLRLGDKIYLIPGHCDPTVNLHDYYVGIRNNVVESLWPVAARGAVF